MLCAFCAKQPHENLIYFQSLYGCINVEVKTYSSKKLYINTTNTNICIFILQMITGNTIVSFIYLSDTPIF